VTTGAATTGAVTTGAVNTDAVITGAVSTGAVNTDAVTAGAVSTGAVTRRRDHGRRDHGRRDRGIALAGEAHLDAVVGEVGARAGGVDVDEGGREEDSHVAAGGGDDLVVVAAVDAREVVRLERDQVGGAQVRLHMQRRHVVPRGGVARHELVGHAGVGVDGRDGQLDVRPDELARLRRHGKRRRRWRAEVEVAAAGVAAAQANVDLGVERVLVALHRADELEHRRVVADVGRGAELVLHLAPVGEGDALRPATEEQRTRARVCVCVWVCIFVYVHVLGMEAGERGGDSCFDRAPSRSIVRARDMWRAGGNADIDQCVLGNVMIALPQRFSERSQRFSVIKVRIGALTYLPAVLRLQGFLRGAS
jgi:hypothetical protein